MLAFIPVHPVQLALGHIPAQVQQFPDTGRRLFPGDEGGAGTLGAFALGNADSLGVVPDGILSAIQIKASAVLSIVLCQEPGIVRLILFEIGADDEAAVLVVSTNAQRLVDYLLRQSRVRENGWLGRTLGLGWLLKRRKIKKGHLLALLGRELRDVRLNEIFFFVDELGGPACHHFPGKYGFPGAGWVRAFPHEQPVLLGLISQALPVSDDLSVPVLISGFQIFRPFLNIAVNREEKLDLIFLIFQVIILVGDDGHDLLFIQKRRELFAACAFFRFLN